ncbi:hypothetical protein PCANC_22982 [Puccinia coronata f. sp. avenae]|uniref:Uncharacterized protein n=1 Tax=Puccinia coronata f. sp. avenae TaxID=200324 RepID=A0A2N5TIE1_9BASI|nr:hypothetical protein PCANC_22982 [Puccinia coronata f. sp. avenae]PLW42769.1 hypothetical protein PCASD_06884 [Puccinia coronata f. sp. avenae]
MPARRSLSATFLLGVVPLIQDVTSSPVGGSSYNALESLVSNSVPLENNDAAFRRTKKSYLVQPRNTQAEMISQQVDQILSSTSPSGIVPLEGLLEPKEDLDGPPPALPTDERKFPDKDAHPADKGAPAADKAPPAADRAPPAADKAPPTADKAPPAADKAPPAADKAPPAADRAPPAADKAPPAADKAPPAADKAPPAADKAPPAADKAPPAADKEGPPRPAAGAGTPKDNEASNQNPPHLNEGVPQGNVKPNPDGKPQPESNLKPPQDGHKPPDVPAAPPALDVSVGPPAHAGAPAGEHPPPAAADASGHPPLEAADAHGAAGHPEKSKTQTTEIAVIAGIRIERVDTIIPASTPAHLPAVGSGANDHPPPPANYAHDDPAGHPTPKDHAPSPLTDHAAPSPTDHAPSPQASSAHGDLKLKGPPPTPEGHPADEDHSAPETKKLDFPGLLTINDPKTGKPAGIRITSDKLKIELSF